MTVYVAAVHGSGSATPRLLTPAHVYSVWDDRPFLLIGFTGLGDPELSESCKGRQHLVPHNPTRHGRQPQASGVAQWWALCPVAASPNTIGEERRYGHVEVEFTAPTTVSFSCVVHPRKYFSPASFRRVLDEIRAHFGWSIEWDAATAVIRSGVVHVSGEEQDDRLVRNVEEELQGVRQWLHLLSRGTHATALAPETRLVAAWQIRRSKVLRSQIQRQEAFLANAVPGAGGRALPRARLDQTRNLYERARAALRELDGLLVRRRLAHGPFALSPSMQRDHRLRRLLRAFAPTQRERWADGAGEHLSELAPLKAADVFEYWCAAALTNAAMACGWTLERREGRQVQPDGGVPVTHQACLRRDDAHLTIWFQPEVAPTDPRSVDSMELRAQQGVEVAAASHGGDGLVAYGTETPDFALLLTTANGRRAFAIGDAALADPARQGGRDKIERMIRYRDRIAWRIDGTTHRCHSLSTFVMLPGPQATWDSTLASVATDSWVFFPDPAADPDESLARRLLAFLENLEQVAR